jgi:hypothetical protein
VYRSTIGKESLHEDSNDNGLRLIDFAIEKKMIIKSTWHALKDVKKETWVSPDGITRNQVDHVIVDRRHTSDIMEVSSCRGADSDTDHYLVRIKYRQKIDMARIRKERRTKHNMEKLQNREQREECKNKLTEMLENKTELLEKGEVEAKWEILRTAINEVADKMLGKTEHKERAQWYDEECSILIQERNEARKRTLQRKTQQAMEEYREKRRIADKICRKKRGDVTLYSLSPSRRG